MIFVAYANAQIIPFTLPNEWTDSNNNATVKQAVQEFSPSSSASSSSNHVNNDYTYYQQNKEDVLLTKEVYPKIIFHKDEQVPFRVRIINNKLELLENILLIEELPWDLNEKSIKLEEGPTIAFNKSFIKIGKSDLLFDYIKVDDYEFNSSLNYSSKNPIVMYYEHLNYLMVFIRQINASEHICLKYNFSIDESKDFVSNPTKLHYKSFLSGNKILESNPVYFSIVDFIPKVVNLEIKPNPTKKSNKNIIFKGIFTDADPYDISKCELWSSIDGLLDSRSCIDVYDKNFSDKNLYAYKFINRNKILSEGDHIITFKVYDQDEQYSESSLKLTVDDYYLDIFPKKYVGWASLLGLIFIFLEISIKEFVEIYKRPKSKNLRDNFLAILMMMVVFSIIFLLPVFLLSKLFGILPILC